MNRYFSKIITALFVCFTVHCNQTMIEETGGIAVIDVVNNLGKYQAIPASEFVTELEYIPLETTDTCLISGVRQIIVTTTYIFVTGNIGFNSVCYAFNRDGRLIGQIGRVGQGPGEYINIAGLSIDEKSKTIYLETPYTLLEYSWDGVFRQSINKPQNMNKAPVKEVFFVSDSLFIGHVPNNRGNEMYKFSLFDQTGQAVQSFDNHEKFERTGNFYTISDYSMRPFRVSERIYVKENAKDTLYFLNEQNELIPQFVFNLGKYTYPKHMREAFSRLPLKVGEVRVSSSLKTDYILISAILPMVGTHNYLFFSVEEGWGNYPMPKGREKEVVHNGQRLAVGAEAIPFRIYDVVNKKTRLMDTDPFSRQSGLINDLDGGLSFWPKYYTSENELVAVWQAHEMKEILTEGYFAAHEIKNPQAHQKLKKLLNHLEEDDNPVVVIAKLK
jgi:hypothetical protein